MQQKKCGIPTNIQNLPQCGTQLMVSKNSQDICDNWPLATRDLQLAILALSILIPLGLTTAIISAADTEIYQKILKSETTIKTISNEEMEDMKIVKPLHLSCLLIKGAGATNENEVMWRYYKQQIVW